VIGDIAATFHFPPESIWEMSAEDIAFWHRQVMRLNKA